MTLTLTIRNPGIGAPRPLTIERRDVAIGRAAGLDWTLPDPQISSRHCEIGFRDGAYLLRDTSTNGTLVNGAKLAGLHRLADRDVIGIGGLEIVVATGAAPAAGMNLDSWQPGPASAPVAAASSLQAAGRTTVPDAGGEARSLEAPLAAALARLMETRKRQLGELGAKLPEALARNPLAGGAAGISALTALPPPAAVTAIAEAVAAIERHHAASLRAMQAALRTAVAELDPKTIATAAGAATSDDARDAALWRAYSRRFDGEGLAGKGFVETFARAFREAYETMA